MATSPNRSTQEILEDMGELATELYSKLDVGRQLQEHPYRTLAMAAGVGYLLGGGLFTRMTGNVLRTGVRLMAIPAFQSALAQAVAPPPMGDDDYTSP